MEAKKIVGYLTPLCTHPGDEISVKISCETESSYRVCLIELICGDSLRRGTGYQERAIDADFAGEYPGKNLPSGVYAVKVRLREDEEDILPFFVSPGPLDKKKDLALLMSTATYIAYANQRLSLGTGIFGKGPRNSYDMYLLDNPEIGNSLYEHHADGSGVHFSSRLRPILNLKPKTLTWSFNADTNLTAWLKAIDQPFDIITDEQLHYEGFDLLDDYRVVISGTHQGKGLFTREVDLSTGVLLK